MVAGYAKLAGLLNPPYCIPLVEFDIALPPSLGSVLSKFPKEIPFPVDANVTNSKEDLETPPP
jgi:hypothetical protein